MTNASATEKLALAKLTELAHKKGWLPPKQRLDVETAVTLSAPLSKIQKILAKELKPGRRLVSAIRFSDGKMQEVTETQLKAIDKGAPVYRDPAPPPADPKAKKGLIDKAKEAVATAAATVPEPARGCPAPDFPLAELRARRVLSAFLDPGQLADFEKHNAFVTTGADTGHRYMVTSRNARGRLEKYARSLYDLDEQTPYCVHDWMVPAAEEMLALHTLVSLPGRERWLRELPELPGGH